MWSGSSELRSLRGTLQWRGLAQKSDDCRGKSTNSAESDLFPENWTLMHTRVCLTLKPQHTSPLQAKRNLSHYLWYETLCRTSCCCSNFIHSQKKTKNKNEKKTTQVRNCKRCPLKLTPSAPLLCMLSITDHLCTLNIKILHYKKVHYCISTYKNWPWLPTNPVTGKAKA